VSEDFHSPTTAGPEPTPVGAAQLGSAYEPDTAAGGSSLPGPLGNLPVDEHPEILVGAAFAGGIVAAFILKRLGR
jgi:hypothetical protein